MLLQIIGLFFMQSFLEVLVMTILAKLGIPYMDFDGGGESIIELLTGIAYYYSMSKVLITALPYIALMFLGYKIYRRPDFVLFNLIISLVLTIIFWLYFDNPVREMLNPVLGTLIAGLFIFFIGRNMGKKDVL